MDWKLPGLAGRTALVTGAANGIGAETARLLAEQGATVYLVDLDDAAGERQAQAIGGHYRHVDLRRESAIVALVREITEREGGVDILVNNAAVDTRVDSCEVTGEFIDAMFRSNLIAPILLARETVPHMRRQQWGAIVNMTSLTFHLGHADMATYSATKGGDIAIMRVWARENGPYGVRCNCVAPGWTDTPRQRQWLDDPATQEWLLERQSIKRFLQPEEVAAAVVFLCSDAASGITGQVLTVDLGWVFNG